ncbi:serine/threonine-protein kinase [Herbiconiux daphne]|uniref:Serine/threonine protein kinase n=1 Tax=Herbiconiux daphne TaxID=2970914 RepID=A0ABT2H3F5_9MICO|nr:serine/threonine-protein kinase [Herbiconiux daphne]MCS5734473.1 serine/threonine protein kinase [Herbiconiux daphne]
MSVLLPESSPNTGELLDGRYRLDSRVGVGGMGVVYRAHDETLGRTVAVKVFNDSAAGAARTASETRLLAALNHSSLVTLFDARVSGEPPDYLVMEYVEGPTLRDRIAEGAIDRHDVEVMTRDLAEALHVVHQAGIVHRDVKPSNVLLRRSHVPGEGFRAKLADFGIAHLIDSTRITSVGTVVGTAAYLSPEQVRGEEPAPAADVYALGLVVIEALTGTRAFAQTGAHEAALARLTSDPVIPGALGYPWKSLLTAMTTRDPAERPTALEVVLAIDRLRLTGAAERAAEPGDAADATDATVQSAAPGGGTVRLGDPTDVTERMVAGDGVAGRLADPDVVTERLTGGAGAGRVADPEVTRVLPSAPAPTQTPTAPSAYVAATSALAEDTAPIRRRAPWRIIIAVIALLVVAAIVGALLWALSASSPAQAPTLPALVDPLGADMQRLLDSVTP